MSNGIRTRWLMLINWAVAGVGLYSTIVYYLWYHLFVSFVHSSRFSDAPYWPMLNFAPYGLLFICGWISRVHRLASVLVMISAIWMAVCSTLFIGYAEGVYQHEIALSEMGFDSENARIHSSHGGPALSTFAFGTYAMLTLELPGIGIAGLAGLLGLLDRPKRSVGQPLQSPA